MNKIKDKIKITGTIKLRTGLYIGGTNDVLAIGEEDTLVIKDPITRMPIIPGSSLKGKMRTMLARDLTNGNDLYLNNINEDDETIKRLFGGKNNERVIYSRLLFRDCFFNKEKSEKNIDGEIVTTEVKTENGINRRTGVATPRQIERVPRGNCFNFELIYNVEVIDEVEEDFENLERAIQLLQWDYLGGNGTRGYGKIQFSELKVESLNNRDYSNLQNILNLD